MDSIKADEPKPQPPELRVTAMSLQRAVRTLAQSTEDAAFDELSQRLAVDPQGTAQRVMELALQNSGSGSAGLSLLRTNSSGHADFEWQSVGGALAGHQGDGTPRSFSPCGRCVDAGSTIIFSRPEREFTYLARLQPAIFDALFVPLYDQAERPVGALWVAHHDPVRHFSADDVRFMERLAAWTKPIVACWSPAE